MCSPTSSSTPPPSKDVVICSKSVNRNVFWSLVLCTFYGLADNLWAGTVFAAYLEITNGDQNSAVGYVEGANGMAALFTAIPVGYLADRYPRSRIIWIGGLALMLTAAAHTSVLFYVGDDVPDDDDVKRRSLILYLVIMAMWGSAGGVVNGPVQALYADSTPSGERSKYYVYLFASYMLSSCFGPLISITLFQYWGDDWTVMQLKNVILVGMALEVVAASCMFFFDDDAALKEDEEEEKGGKGGDQRGKTDGQADEIISDLDKRRRRIPYLLFCFDMVVSLGSGMTVKFFPLFFKNDANLTPTEVQVIYLIVPIVMVACSGIGQKMSKSLGRVQTIITVKSLGLSLLYILVFQVDYLVKTPLLLVPIYVLRTGLINSTYPLQESILMDFVPKNERARWKSLESVSQFGWCGSAVLGGYLADKYDYTFTFLITAILQSVGVVGYTLLLPLVPRSEKALADARASSTSDLTRPLLDDTRESTDPDSSRMTGVV